MPQVFRYVTSLELIEEAELYRSFNMGVGMVLVVPKEQADEVLQAVRAHEGHEGFLIGTIENSDSEMPKVVLR